MADSGFKRPDLPNLISTIRSDLLTRFETDVVLRRLDAEVYGRVMAAAVHTLYGYLEYLAKNMLPDQADEAWLVRHGNLKQVPRKQPTTAAGYARWDSVVSPVTLPAGTEIQTDAQVEYVTTADATVGAEGVLRAPVEAVEPGTGGNLDDGSALRLLTPVNGLSSTGYAESVQGGTDLEGLEDWRARIMARWYYMPQGGADADYKIWATDVAGVSRAWVYRNYSGRGTVGVMVANSDPDNPVPDETIVAAVEQYILPLAPVAGSGLFIFPPTARAIDLQIALAKDTAAIRAAVTREIKSMLLRDGEPGATVYLSRISEAVSLAAGEVAHRIETPEKDITLGTYEIPVLGAVTWTNYNAVTPTLGVTLDAFSSAQIYPGGNTTAAAHITPDALVGDPDLVISWDFDSEDFPDDGDPAALATMMTSADSLAVTVAGVAVGVVHPRVTVQFQGQTATATSPVTIVEPA